MGDIVGRRRFNRFERRAQKNYEGGRARMSCGGGGAATIPVVDLSADEAEAIASLKAACETTGFFFLKGHGIEEDLVSSVFAGAKRFFSRSQEQKDAFKAKEGQ